MLLDQETYIQSVQLSFYLQVLVSLSYTEKHQIQLFGRGHIGGIDIKVNIHKTAGVSNHSRNHGIRLFREEFKVMDE